MVTLVFDRHNLECCIIFDRLYFPYWLEKQELGQHGEKRRCVSSSCGSEAPLLHQMWNEAVVHFEKRDYLPIFCTILFLKNAPGSQAGLPMLLQSEFGPAALFFSEPLNGPCCRCIITIKAHTIWDVAAVCIWAYASEYLWMTWSPPAAYLNDVLYPTRLIYTLLPNVLQHAKKKKKKSKKTDIQPVNPKHALVHSQL